MCLFRLALHLHLQKYEDLAQGDKERYAEEMKEHEEESDAPAKTTASKAATGCVPNFLVDRRRSTIPCSKKAAASMAHQAHVKGASKKVATPPKTKKKKA